MKEQQLRQFLTDKGWLTVSNICSNGFLGTTPPEVRTVLKGLTIRGELDVKAGFAAGPRMYRLRRKVT